MSPIVIFVFAPVVVIGLIFYAVLLGAIVAGVCEAAESRAERKMLIPRQSPPQERASTRAA
jgi:hypothetical protein